MSNTKKILITGGAGFIGTHLVKHFVEKYPHYKVFNLDDLTYAGNLENLKDIDGKSNYRFLKADITDRENVLDLFRKEKFDQVIHLAAESHVDRSILSPGEFVRTNILGTVNLLDAAREVWKPYQKGQFFYHISTDEVFGTLGETGHFTEDTPYDPQSPYSASKASADHFVRAYYNTYRLPVKLSNSSNNYGPYQFPEKLLPLMINNIKNQKPLPVYGKGENVRDWLWVEDHVRAIDLVFHKGTPGETYLIGGRSEINNIDLVKKLCRIMDRKLDREEGESAQLITFVKDREGHDKRYAVDPGKVEKALGWKPEMDLENGLEKTVEWYLASGEWLKRLTSGKYREYYERQYMHRNNN